MDGCVHCLELTFVSPAERVESPRYKKEESLAILKLIYEMKMVISILF